MSSLMSWLKNWRKMISSAQNEKRWQLILKWQKCWAQLAPNCMIGKGKQIYWVNKAKKMQFICILLNRQKRKKTNE